MNKANFSATLFLAVLVTLSSALSEGSEKTAARLSKTSAPQAGATYALTIKDETGAEIGQYFDIRIDSFMVQGDTTVNFQMIPNLVIQDSILQQRYSTFLEMLLRNTGKEAEAVTDTSTIIGSFNTLNRNWGPAIDVFIGDEYNGTDDTLRVLLNELNSGLGQSYFTEVSSPTNKGWNFDLSKVDWRLDREVRKEIVFNPDGTPSKCTFFIQGLFKYGNDLQGRMRHQIAVALLLNRAYSRELIDTEAYDPKYFKMTRFSPDFINLLKVGNALSNGRYFRYDLNEQNRAPVANAGPDPKDKRVGQLIILDATASLDPDGEMVSYLWQQIFGTKMGTEYITSNKALLSDSTSPLVTFVPEWSGNYRFKLIVTDDDGSINQANVDVKVFPNESLFDIKGADTGLFANWGLYGVASDGSGNIFRIPPDFFAFKMFDELKENNFNAIQFTPALFIKENSFEIHSWIGGTIPDSVLARLIELACQNNFIVGLETNLVPVKENWDPSILTINNNPWNFIADFPFDNLSQNDIERFLSNYTSIQKKYVGIMKTANPSGGIISLGNDLGYMLVEYEPLFNQFINIIKIENPNAQYTISAAVWKHGGNLVDYNIFSNLDYIGLNIYPPASNILDPSITFLKQNIEGFLLTEVLPAVTKFNRDVLFLEHGIANADGASIEPATTFCNDGSLPIDNREQVEFMDAFYQVLREHPELRIRRAFYFDHGFVPSDSYQVVRRIGQFDYKDKPLQEFLKLIYKLPKISPNDKQIFR